MAWNNGPLPPNTWGWGGVTTYDTESGFYFADFCGDHVLTVPDGRKLQPHEVKQFDNSLTLPITPKQGVGGAPGTWGSEARQPKKGD
jgi:hypothetical protein